MPTRAYKMVLVLTLILSISSAQAPPPSKPDLHALAALEPIDTHTHVAKGDPSFYAMLDRLHMHIVDILLVDDQEAYRKDLNTERRDADAVAQASHGHAALCTSFDPFRFGDRDFAASAIRGIDEDFAKGAVAVKIWKNIGMELKDKNGRYVLPDDPAFEPIYRDIEKHNRTLIAHQAEPDEAWQPPNPTGLDYPYYKENPFWYMYKKPDAPKKQQILDARDHLLAENPKLRVVGAHLGSMEDDLDGLGQRLDRYPNFAVDTAARVVHLVMLPSDRVRNFILKYQDRIVYGTDLGVSKEATPADVIKEWEEQYANDWRYFATQDKFQYDGHQTQGLGLPPAVLRKLYHANAMHWFPGIIASH
jgi:predicted TIM-barrel fold metal-dependent hydrolase